MAAATPWADIVASFSALEGDKGDIIAGLTSALDSIVAQPTVERYRRLHKVFLDSKLKQGSPLGNAAIAMLLRAGFAFSEDKEWLSIGASASTDEIKALRAALSKEESKGSTAEEGKEGKDSKAPAKLSSSAGAPGGPSAGGAAAEGKDVLLALRVDFPPTVQVAQIDGSQPLSAFLVGASRLLGIDRETLARYTIRAARLGSDVIELSESDIKSTPITELGISTGWSLLYAAPADIKPPPRRRKKEVPSDGKEESGTDAKFAGLTPGNALGKMKVAKGKTLANILEYIDRRWGEIVTTSKREVLNLPATTLQEIFKRDTLCGKEIDIWNTALLWAKEENKRKKITDSPETLRTAIAPLLPHIRLPVMSASEMAGSVAPSGILLPEQLLTLFSHVATAAARSGSSSSSSSSSSAKKVPAAMGPKVAGFLATKRTGAGVSIRLDPSRKGTVLVLSNDNRTVTGGPSTVAGTVLATVGYSEGQHYWEMKIEKGRTGGHLFIGLCLESMDVNQYLSGSGAQYSFGWYHTAAYGVPGALASSPTGTFTFAMGDTVGFRLDCDRHKLEMYVNKRYTGEVTLASGNKYYPAFGCYGNEEQLTLIDDPEVPPPRS